MSASRLIHERNLLGKLARAEEAREKARKEREGQEHESRKERLVAEILAYMTREDRP